MPDASLGTALPKMSKNGNNNAKKNNNNKNQQELLMVPLNHCQGH